MRLTQNAQIHVSQHLGSGDIAIDATAGNGHDTLFLAQQVGLHGRVFVFDIQQSALDLTQRLLDSSGQCCDERIEFISDDHANILQHIDLEYRHRAKAIMFNLGYLPGGDKSIITRYESTLKGLDASIELLHPNGIITVLAYRGHAGGSEEFMQVREWMLRLPKENYHVLQDPSEAINSGPVLFVVRPTGNS